jgi:hypothetical protein
LALPIVGDLLPRYLQYIEGGIERGMGDREGYRTDRVGGSVGDPDPQDPHVFGPPGSGSISQRYGSGSFPFLIKVLIGLKDCLQNKILTQNFRKNLPPQSH